MINTDFRRYTYSTLGDIDDYGQPVDKPSTSNISMAIYLNNQSLNQNDLYSTATYVGLTYDKVEDNYIINYKGLKLKVLYVNNQGRLNSVYMVEYND